MGFGFQDYGNFNAFDLFSFFIFNPGMLGLEVLVELHRHPSLVLVVTRIRQLAGQGGLRSHRRPHRRRYRCRLGCTVLYPQSYIQFLEPVRRFALGHPDSFLSPLVYIVSWSPVRRLLWVHPDIPREVHRCILLEQLV